MGNFVVEGDDASYMTCGAGIHNSITHRKGNIEKTNVKASWTAPSGFEGEVTRHTRLLPNNMVIVHLGYIPILGPQNL